MIWVYNIYMRISGLLKLLFAQGTIAIVVSILEDLVERLAGVLVLFLPLELLQDKLLSIV